MINQDCLSSRCNEYNKRLNPILLIMLMNAKNFKRGAELTKFHVREAWLMHILEHLFCQQFYGKSKEYPHIH